MTSSGVFLPLADHCEAPRPAREKRSGRRGDGAVAWSRACGTGSGSVEGENRGMFDWEAVQDGGA